MNSIKYVVKKVITLYAVKIIASTVAVSFLLTSVCASALSALIEKEPSQIQNLNDLNLDNFAKITSENFSDGGVLVVNVLDLHSNPYVQRNIAKIIEYFDKEYGVESVYLEGAYGQADISWLSVLNGGDVKDAALNSMLESGRLTGAEYYSFLSGRYNIIRGLENKEVYFDNLKRFAQILNGQNEIQTLLNEAEKELERAAQMHYNNKQKKFDILQKSYSYGKISARKYYKRLLLLSEELGIEKEKYANVSLCSALSEFEKGLNYKELPKELNSFLVRVQRIIPYKLYLEISQDRQDLSNDGKIFASLSKIVSEYNLNISKEFPNLYKFLQYFELSRKINPIGLYKEEKALAGEIKAGFETNETETQAAMLAELFGYYKDFLSAEITADDYRYYEKNKESFKSLWTKLVGNDRLLPLSKYENSAADFYAANEKRNDYFLENIKLPSKNEKTAVIVITGGFHTQALTGEFSKNGVSNITVVPGISETSIRTSAQNYRRIAKEQSKVLFNALAALPLYLSPEEIKIAALASSVNSIEEANKIISEFIDKNKDSAGGVKNAVIEKGENGAILLKIDAGSKRITYSYDETKKEFLNPFTAPYNAETEGKIEISKTKKFFLRLLRFMPYKFSFPKIYASAKYFEDMPSYEHFQSGISGLKKNKINSFEFDLTFEDGKFGVKIKDGFISAERVLDIVSEGKKTSVILNIPDEKADFDSLFKEVLRSRASVRFASSDADFIAEYCVKYPDASFIFSLKDARQYTDLKNIISPSVRSVSADKKTYEVLKERLGVKINGILTEIFIRSPSVDNYNDYIGENENSLALISEKPFEKYKNYDAARAVLGNLKALPVILLISNLDLFNSFWTLYIQRHGHPLSLINMAIALCAPFYILSSFLAKNLSEKIGHRNVIIEYLVLQILGSAMLYLSSVSPVFVLIFIIIPVFSQGGIASLFTPFMQASLNAIGKIDKAPEVDAKSRSLLWIFVAIAIFSGGALSASIGQSNVIIVSTALLTTLLAYVIVNSKTVKKAKDFVEKAKDKIKIKAKEKIKKTFLDLKEILKNKTLAGIFTSTIFIEILMTAVVAIESQSVLSSSGFSVTAIAGILFAANIIQSVASAAAYTWKIPQLIKKSVPRNLFWLSITALIAAFVLIGNPLLFIAFYAVIVIFWTVSVTVESSYNAQNIPEDKISAFYSFRLFFDAAVSAVFSVAIAQTSQGSSDASVLGKVIFGATAVSAAAAFAISALYSDRGSKKLKIFNIKTDAVRTRKILQSA
ncbi:MAG: MFS transporter [Endomicrobium sp.]|jgi:hypothetical protein|nr:MFS transporter [Endomicrobium sp.]